MKKNKKKITEDILWYEYIIFIVLKTIWMIPNLLSCFLAVGPRSSKSRCFIWETYLFWNIFSVNRTLYFYSKNSPWNQYCNHIETSQLNCNPKQMNGFRMSERCFKRVKVVISVSQTCTLSRLATLEQKINSITLRKKWSFPLSISSVNVTKSAGICGFGHIYWRNPSWKTSFFVQCYFHDNCECITKASKRPFRSKFKPSE